MCREFERKLAGKIFDHCAQDGIPSGGTKMKFRWKLMIITMLIVSFSFGFGGMLLIQYSYQASIKQEKEQQGILTK